jgi:hypothetical protein
MRCAVSIGHRGVVPLTLRPPEATHERMGDFHVRNLPGKACAFPFAAEKTRPAPSACSDPSQRRRLHQDPYGRSRSSRCAIRTYAEFSPIDYEVTQAEVLKPK